MSGAAAEGSGTPAARPAATAADCPVDFAFLREQADGDAALMRDLLGLFVAQVRRVMPGMAAMPAVRRGETAHLLKGSCRAIGARTAAAAAQAVEDGPGEAAALARLAADLAAAEAAILAHLAGPGNPT